MSVHVHATWLKLGILALAYVHSFRTDSWEVKYIDRNINNDLDLVFSRFSIS